MFQQAALLTHSLVLSQVFPLVTWAVQLVVLVLQKFPAVQSLSVVQASFTAAPLHFFAVQFATTKQSALASQASPGYLKNLNNLFIPHFRWNSLFSASFI